MKNWRFSLFPLWNYSIWKISKPFVWFFLCQQTVLLKFEDFVEESRTQTLIKTKIYRDSATSNIIISLLLNMRPCAGLPGSPLMLGIWNVKSLLYLFYDSHCRDRLGSGGWGRRRGLECTWTNFHCALCLGVVGFVVFWIFLLARRGILHCHCQPLVAIRGLLCCWFPASIPCTRCELFPLHIFFSINPGDTPSGGIKYKSNKIPFPLLGLGLGTHWLSYTSWHFIHSHDSVFDIFSLPLFL